MPAALGLALVSVAGGDPPFLQALRRMAWEDYLDDGPSDTLDEAGLARWWAAQLATPS